MDFPGAEITLGAPPLLCPVQCVQGIDADPVDVRIGRDVLSVERVEFVVPVATGNTGLSRVTLIAGSGIVVEADVHLGHKFQKICRFLPQFAFLVQGLSVAGVTVSFGPQSMLASNTCPCSDQNLQPVLTVQQLFAVHTFHVVRLNSTICRPDAQKLADALATEEDGLGVACGAHRELARAVAEALHQHPAVAVLLVVLLEAAHLHVGDELAVGDDQQGEGEDQGQHGCSMSSASGWC